MTARLELEAKLDTRAASDLTAALAENAGADLALDATAVGHIGGLALQTLLVAGAAWSASGHTLSFENLSDEAADQLRLFGVTPDGLTAGKVG